MEPNYWWLVDRCVSLSKGPFSGSMLIVRGEGDTKKVVALPGGYTAVSRGGLAFIRVGLKRILVMLTNKPVLPKMDPPR